MEQQEQQEMNQTTTPTPETPVKPKSFTWIYIIVLFLLIAGGSGVYLVKQNMSKNAGNNNAMVTPTAETPTATPTETDEVTVTPTPTSTGATAPTTKTQKVVLEDPVGGYTFEYTFAIPSAASVEVDPNKTYFSINLGGAGSFFVQQRYEAFNNKIASFEEVSGNLGTYYRIGTDEGVMYASSVQKVGTCDNMGDEPFAAPCGLETFIIPDITFMAAFSCEGTTNAVCDAVMASFSVRQL